MSLVLNEEQQLLRDSARDFLNRQAPLSRFRELRDNGDATGFSRTLWSEMADMGWPAIAIPEQYGGLDYGNSGLGIVLEECGRTLASSPMMSTALMGTLALVESGNRELCETWLPEIATGEKLLALAIEEHNRHRPENVSLTATPAGTGYELNGRKTAVLDGHVADGLIVSARNPDGDSGSGGISLFLVDRDQPGIRVQYTALLDNHGAARIRFSEVEASARQLLCPADTGWRVLEKTLDAGRIGAAAELLGIARETFERTVEYLKERKQFGVPIGIFQALQHRTAILFGEIELCRSVVLKALHALDEADEQLPLLASLAKARAGFTARLATAEAIQMHGGIGMTDEFDIGFFIKRYKSLEQVLGDTNYHLERFARLRGY
jgi:alkylation response protein AidB-like acyl-CoA dehydrogenase